MSSSPVAGPDSLAAVSTGVSSGASSQVPTPPVAAAFAEVRRHAPAVCMVLVGPDGRWLFLDAAMEAPALPATVDVRILERAAASVAAVPALFVDAPRLPVGAADPFVVHVGWGDEPDADADAAVYRFATAEARDAFVLGVTEARGWLDSVVLSGPARFDADAREWQLLPAG